MDSPLPEPLRERYGGGIGFAAPCLFANFVATIDGVVAIPSLPGSNRVIAAASQADRFVMGLLRACAGAVIVGSGTLAASPNGGWTPARAFPDGAEDFAGLRASLGLAPDPLLVVLSASGRIDPAHPALASAALLLTSDAGAARLEGLLPAATELQVLGRGPRLGPGEIVAELHRRGHRLLLSEGGPAALGAFLGAGLVDQLFLTVSPLLLGRPDGEPRLALVEGVDLLGAADENARLLGVRRSGDHLFLRYALGPR